MKGVIGVGKGRGPTVGRRKFVLFFSIFFLIPSPRDLRSTRFHGEWKY